MKRAWLSTVALMFCGLFIASCANTIRGAGADLQETANAVEDVVE